MKDGKNNSRRLFFWVIMLVLFIFVLLGFSSTISISKPINTQFPDSSILQLSENLLYKVKTKKATYDIEELISKMNFQKLISGLNNDNAIKTFW